MPFITFRRTAGTSSRSDEKLLESRTSSCMSVSAVTVPEPLLDDPEVASGASAFVALDFVCVFVNPDFGPRKSGPAR